ncbi:hypothetical protein EOD23_13810 [Mesorhizobium sp. USDA-HM6]|nr:hypothetical protein EOD23_13810 [Mesorhizobium sp. USDA-HM6]
MDDRSVDVPILRSRRKLEANPAKPRLIKTSYGTSCFFNADLMSAPVARRPLIAIVECNEEHVSSSSEARLNSRLVSWNSAYPSIPQMDAIHTIIFVNANESGRRPPVRELARVRLWPGDRRPAFSKR